MSPRSLLLFVTASLLAAASFAAEVRLGAEAALSPAASLGPAAFDQEQPDVASNGNDFLVVWIDRRSSGPDAPLFAARVGEDGHPIDARGQKLAEVGRFPQIASAGGDYLIAFANGGSYALRVDENGRAMGEVRTLATNREPRELVSNGATYLLLEANRNRGGLPPLTATILDRDGAPLKKLDGTFGTLLWAGAYDGRYVVIDVPAGCDLGCKGAPALHVISESGSVLSRVSLPFVPEAATYLSAVASPDRVMITSYTFSTSTGSTLVGDYDGDIIRARSPLPGDVFQTAAAWDGREFLVVYSNLSTPTTSALRVATNGASLGEPFPLNTERVLPLFASNGAKQLLVWAGRHFAIFNDVVARATESFAALPGTPEQPELVSYSPAAQYDVRLASSSAGTLAVWRDSNFAMEGALNGALLSILPRGSDRVAAPSVAAGKQNFLVVWYDVIPYEVDYKGWDLLAKRIAFDGRVLDDTPIVLAKNLLNSQGDNPGITYDGSSFIVTAEARYMLRTVRVSDDGVVEEQRTIEDRNAAMPWPEPVWTGTRTLIAHALYRYTFGCDICEPQWSVAVDGVPLFENAGLGNRLRVAAAAGRDRVTLAWMSLEGETRKWTIQVAQLSLDGDAISAPRRLRTIDVIPSAVLDLAWNGSEYVLAWGEINGRLRAMRLNRFAEAMDAEPFDIAQQAPWGRFSLAATASGVTFGYDRRDPASGDVTRAFLRTLERLPSGPPRRSVRH